MDPITLFIISQLIPGSITSAIYEAISGGVKRFLKSKRKTPTQLLEEKLQEALELSKNELDQAYFDVSKRFAYLIVKHIGDSTKVISDPNIIKTQSFKTILHNAFKENEIQYDEFEIEVIKNNLWKLLIIEDEIFKEYVVNNLSTIVKTDEAQQKVIDKLIKNLNEFTRKSDLLERSLAFKGVLCSALMSVGSASLAVGMSLVFTILPILRETIQKGGSQQDWNFINVLNNSVLYFVMGGMMLIAVAVFYAYVNLYKRKK